MPHLIKKFVNALKRSGLKKHKIALHFKRTKMSLKMLQQVWEKSPDGQGGANLRITKLSKEHFLKNAYSRMRVYLATQVMSESMNGLIDDYADEVPGGKAAFKSLQVFIRHSDRLTDIVNARYTHNGKLKGCEAMDCPDHKHVGELLEILDWFAEWKQESEKKRKKEVAKVWKNEKRRIKGYNKWFIPNSSYEDLGWLVFGLGGLAGTYLLDDKSRTLDQSKSGSDTCEHAFAAMRNANSNPTLSDARMLIRKESGKSMTFSICSRANTAGGKRETWGELFAPLQKLENCNK